jgi:hypothetical protein
MTLRIWRGDAPAVAQKTRITPSGVEIGDVYTLTINGKSISVTATAATAANVCTLLATAIAASTIAEFREFTVTNSTSSLLLTASVAGVPFVITGTTTNGSTPGVTIETTTSGSAAGAGTNMTQSFAIPSVGTGDFSISIGGQIVSGIPRNASAATVQTAVEGLSTIGSGNVSVARTSDLNGYVFTLTFQGTLAATTVATAVVSLASDRPLVRTIQNGSVSGTVVNEIQTIDTGSITGSTTFDLTYTGITLLGLACNTSAAALESLFFGSYSVAVSKVGSVFTLEWVGGWSGSDIGTPTVTTYSAGTSTHPITVTTTAASGGVAGVNEVQTVTLTGSPTGGTFTLTYEGQTTGTIAYDASAATVDTALEALSNIGSGDVAVTGSAGGPFTVTFGGALAATNVSQLTANSASLTGGSGQSVSVSDEVASSGPNHWDTAANWLPSGIPANSDDVRFEIGSVNCLYGLAQSAVTLASFHVSMRYSGQIGLPRLNSSGYLEYRGTELAIGATSILIGHGDGSGPSKVALNVGSVAAAIEIRDSGGSSESGIPAITWRGTSSSNAIQQYGGELGIAQYSDQSATVATLIQRGGTLDAKHTAFVTSLLFTSANFFDCTLNGNAIESYR